MFEVSLACALGVFGTQLGQALGFLIPPMVVKNSDNLEQISDELGVLIKSLAVFTSIVTIIILACTDTQVCVIKFFLRFSSTPAFTTKSSHL